ncbi:hypothetical protein LSTR_LSTR004591 [Laodelphax striatellus]|uniref:Peregrin n=1 Tax=Laodelphax striatellus TaxID=195883 RepID=A0A482WTS2_LAOST|nr:hypothetical protein LSTR_LSTR004591 [Laodelphax striatellus]
MGVDFDVLEYCQKLKITNKPPYKCPVVECGKPYKSMSGLQYHLVNFDHSAPIQAHTPVAPATPMTPKKANRKKGRNSHAAAIKAEPLVSPAREGLTYAEAQKFVEFELNGKVKRISIDQKIPLVSVSKNNTNKQSPVNTASITSLAKSQEAVSKLPEPCFKVLDNYNIPDAPPRPNAYIRFIEKSPEELDGEVEYDMDEEDAAWLAIMNERRATAGLPDVPIDTFELLMDRLEKESYFQMSTTGKTGDGQQIMDDEAVCCICMDGECENSNVILFCDMCNLAVHQDCYGVPYIPEGQWLCRRCLQSPSRSVDCVLCPNIGGAFKQTDRGHWAHVVCALWIPEVRFANTVFLEPIDSIETIPPARWKLTCYICKQRGVGACIQCHKTNCYSAFHVTCAQQAGLYMKMDTVRDTHSAIVGGEPGPVMVQKTAFCDSHTPADSEGKVRPLQVQAASPLPDDNDKAKNKRRMLAKKRTSVPVISIPTIPPDRIQEIGSLVTIAKKSQFIQRLIAYWTLKRHFRNGVPLLRRLQSSHLSRRDEPRHNQEVVSDIGEMYRQLKYWQCLRQDLERVRLLCELVRKREKLKKELIKVEAMRIELQLCPLNNRLRKLLDALRDLDTGEIFIEPVDQTEVPDYGDIVKHPMDLSTMTKKLDDYCYSSLEELEADFKLMIQNCLDYNAKDTVFYRAAIKMKEQGAVALRQARKDIEKLNLDQNCGLLDVPEATPQPNAARGEKLASEIDKELADITDSNNSMDEDQKMCKLLQLLDRSGMLKNTIARNSRLKRIKLEISKMKRRKSQLFKRNNPVKSVANTDTDGAKTSDDDAPLRPAKTVTAEDTPKPDADTESGNASDTAQKSVLSTPSKSGDSNGSEAQLTASPSGVNRRSAVLFRKTPTKKRSKNDGTSSPGPGDSDVPTTPSRRRGRQSKKNAESTSEGKDDAAAPLPSTDSFRVYRTGGDVSDDECESDDDESSCSGCSAASDGSSVSGSGCGSSSSCESSDDDVTTEETSQEALEQLQLVWAKCRGYPWYPALELVAS